MTEKLNQPAGQKCVSYKCVPSSGAGQSEGCPSGKVKRCAEFK